LAGLDDLGESGAGRSEGEKGREGDFQQDSGQQSEHFRHFCRCSVIGVVVCKCFIGSVLWNIGVFIEIQAWNKCSIFRSRYLRQFDGWLTRDFRHRSSASQ
jgi:hypothetical protein